MESDTRYRASHPQAWPIIAVYGAVVMGVAAYSYLNHERRDRTSASSTSIAAADINPLFPHPYSSGTRHSIEPAE